MYRGSTNGMIHIYPNHNQGLLTKKKPAMVFGGDKLPKMIEQKIPVQPLEAIKEVYLEPQIREFQTNIKQRIFILR